MTTAAHSPDAKLRRGIRQSVQSYLGGFGSKANMNLCTASADISLPGFQGPTMEILTPPSDHIPLRRRCSFGGSIPHPTTPSCWLQRTGPLAAGVLTHWRRNSRRKWLVGVDRL